MEDRDLPILVNSASFVPFFFFFLTSNSGFL